MIRDLVLDRPAGVRIAARDFGGDGADLVLVHGGTHNLGDWVALMPLLGPHFRCVALDLRGHGQSTRAIRMLSRLARRSA